VRAVARRRAVRRRAVVDAAIARRGRAAAVGAARARDAVGVHVAGAAAVATGEEHHLLTRTAMPPEKSTTRRPAPARWPRRERAGRGGGSGSWVAGAIMPQPSVGVAGSRGAGRPRPGRLAQALGGSRMARCTSAIRPEGRAEAGALHQRARHHRSRKPPILAHRLRRPRAAPARWRPTLGCSSGRQEQGAKQPPPRRDEEQGEAAHPSGAPRSAKAPYPAAATSARRS